MSEPKAPEIKKLAIGWIGVLGIYHAAFAIFLIYAICQVWPPQPWPGDKQIAPAPTPRPSPTGQPLTAGAANPSPTNAPNASAGAAASPTPSPTPHCTGQPGDECPPKFTLLWKEFQPRLDVRLILIVILAGALGSYIHVATSLADYAGNGRLSSNWVLWYLLRPFIGISLALLFYFVFRGGFLPAGGNGTDSNPAAIINPFGIAALAGLVGMFSKTASDKLNEIFKTMFRSAPGEGDAKRKDKLNNLAPKLKGLIPSTGKKGAEVSVTINGSDFAEKASVLINRVARQPQFVSVTELKVQLTKEDTANIGSLEIKVVNPPPENGTSEPLPFTITEE